MNDIVYVGLAAEGALREHTHKGFEVAIADRDGGINCGKMLIEYKRGDILVIPRLVKHCNPSVTGLTVLMENAVMPLKEICVISGSGAEEISWVLKRASDYFSAETKGKAAVLDGLGRLLNALITAYCGGNDFSPVVRTLLAEVDKNLSDPTFSLEYSISSLPLNYDYVRKLFKKEVGLTPLEYLTSARMSRAKDIMLSGVTNRYSRYTISQIAEMCGFAEPLYFSRVFKKYYGISPTEYAAKNK